MKPLVSVVIPCHGQAHFVADAIRSVFAQAYPAVELVVVNDGAPDTARLEQAVAPFITRIEYLRQEHRGLSAARNAGLDRARGELLVFLDADDRLLPNALADGVAALAARPECGLVWGYRHLINTDGDRYRWHLGRIGDGERYVDLLRTNIIGPPVGVMWRRSMLLAIGGFSESLSCAEDYDAYLRIAFDHPIHCHGATVAEYRLHPGNMSNDVQRMLAAVEQLLARQADRVAGDAGLLRALRAGRRDARFRYVWMPHLDELARQVFARRWRQAWRTAAFLLVRFPVRFASIVIRRGARVAWVVFVRGGRGEAPAPQEPASSGIVRPSAPAIAQPSIEASVGARSTVDTILPS